MYLQRLHARKRCNRHRVFNGIGILRSVLYPRNTHLLQRHALWKLHLCILYGWRSGILFFQWQYRRQRCFGDGVPGFVGCVWQQLYITIKNLHQRNAFRKLYIRIVFSWCRSIMHLQWFDGGKWSSGDGVSGIVGCVWKQLYITVENLQQRHPFRQLYQCVVYGGGTACPRDHVFQFVELIDNTGTEHNTFLGCFECKFTLGEWRRHSDRHFSTGHPFSNDNIHIDGDQ